MPPNEIHLRTTQLLRQLSDIKNESITENLFNSFVAHAKSESNSMLNVASDQEIRNQLISISSFKPYNQLKLIERIFIRIVVFRFQFNWFGSWKMVGKYWNDLHSIELKLQGILYKLENKTA